MLAKEKTVKGSGDADGDVRVGTATTITAPAPAVSDRRSPRWRIAPAGANRAVEAA